MFLHLWKITYRTKELTSVNLIDDITSKTLTLGHGDQRVAQLIKVFTNGNGCLVCFRVRVSLQSFAVLELM